MDGGIMSRDWSAEYNEFPMEIRTICAGLHCNIRIQHLNYESVLATEPLRCVPNPDVLEEPEGQAR